MPYVPESFSPYASYKILGSAKTISSNGYEALYLEADRGGTSTTVDSNGLKFSVLLYLKPYIKYKSSTYRYYKASATSDGVYIDASSGNLTSSTTSTATSSYKALGGRYKLMAFSTYSYLDRDNEYTIDFSENPVTLYTKIGFGSSSSPSTAKYTWTIDNTITITIPQLQFICKFIKNTPSDIDASDITLPTSVTTYYHNGDTIANPGSAVDTTGTHTFQGWYTDSACTTAASFPITVGTSDINLYAKWSGVGPSVKVKVNGDWQDGSLKAKVNGTWVDATAAYLKVDGTWIEIE